MSKKFVKKKMPTTYKIKIDDFLQRYCMNCRNCEMYYNCTQTYKECRSYNKELWNNIDKQVNKIRKEIFKSIKK